MTNLIITNRCNLRCPFCFATESRAGEGVDAAAMSLEEFERLVEQLGLENSVGFCGGEPSAHPRFVEMVEATLRRPGATVFVMSNGLWPKEVQAYFGGLSTELAARVSFLFNVLEPQLYRGRQRETLQATLRSAWARNTMLGFTIYKAPFDHRPMLELAQQHGIRSIRYSIAAPSGSDPRTWLIDPEADFKPLASTLLGLFRDAVGGGFKLSSDCGYLPPCAFSEEQLGELALLFPSQSPLVFGCGTALDVGPGGEAWRCYGLYDQIRANAYDYPSTRALVEDFDRRTSELSSLLLFEKCRGCDYRARGICQGGCYAMRVSRLKQRYPALNLFPSTRDVDLLECRPVHTAELALRRTAAGDREVVLMRGGKVERISADDPAEDQRLLAFLDAADGRRTLRELIPLLPDTDLLSLGRTLLEWGLIRFERDLPAAFPGAQMRDVSRPA